MHPTMKTLVDKIPNVFGAYPDPKQKSGTSKEAIDYIKRLAETDPDKALRNAYNLIEQLYMELDRREEALDGLREDVLNFVQ